MVRVIEGSHYRGQNYSECMTEIQGKSILVRVSEGSSYRESTVSKKEKNLDSRSCNFLDMNDLYLDPQRSMR